MSISVQDYVSGGYLLTQYIDGIALNQWLRSVHGVTEDLLPDRMLSVGFCGASYAPVLSWTSNTEEEYTAFGIATSRIAQLEVWSDPKFGSEIGFPNLFFRLATAQEYVQTFISENSDAQLLGIGLHKERLYQIAELEQLRPGRIAESGAKMAGFADTGFAKALRLGALPGLGENLGFDVICCFYNIDHSWHCSGLSVDGLQKFHFRPNQFGLIDEKLKADQLADYANTIQSEHGTWLPVLVTRFAL